MPAVNSPGLPGLAGVRVLNLGWDLAAALGHPDEVCAGFHGGRAPVPDAKPGVAASVPSHGP